MKVKGRRDGYVKSGRKAPAKRPLRKGSDLRKKPVPVPPRPISRPDAGSVGLVTPGSPPRPLGKKGGQRGPGKRVRKTKK